MVDAASLSFCTGLLVPPADHAFTGQQSLVHLPFFRFDLDQQTRARSATEQALTNGESISANREQGNLEELSSLGHFLKGSSATLGFNKIRDSCQIIQQYGHRLTVDGTPETDDKVCLKKIDEAIKAVKVDSDVLEKLMRKFFVVEE
jgi:osomolarity two-component system phosphorelay intermediate protein YPD1